MQHALKNEVHFPAQFLMELPRILHLEFGQTDRGPIKELVDVGGEFVQQAAVLGPDTF